MMNKEFRDWLESEIQHLKDVKYASLVEFGIQKKLELVIKKYDELHKPAVIPKYVAEWITKYREKYDLYPALRLLENNTLVWGSIYEWYRTNTQKFVNAYLTGEYEVEEEPLYYALIKGHELIAGEDACKYWKCDMRNGSMFLSNRYSHYGRYLAEMTENDWGKFGINESNADFVKADE